MYSLRTHQIAPL